jgi:hypothetical protein
MMMVISDSLIPVTDFLARRERVSRTDIYPSSLLSTYSTSLPVARYRQYDTPFIVIIGRQNRTMHAGTAELYSKSEKLRLPSALL